MSITFRKLSTFLINNSLKEDFYSFVKKECRLSDESFQLHKRIIDQHIRNHRFRYNTKCRGNLMAFYKKYDSWLNTELTFSDVGPQAGSKRRRSFEVRSERTKRRLVDSLRTELDVIVLKEAYLKNLKEEDPVSAKIVQKLILMSTEQKEFILNLIEKGEFKEKTTFSADDALALYLDTELSKAQYLKLKASTDARNCEMFPSYVNLHAAKESCYPRIYKVTEKGASIRMQDLLDITASKIISLCDIEPDKANDLELLSKWGMDGASSQSSYKQVFEDDGLSDESMFMVSLVRLA